MSAIMMPVGYRCPRCQDTTYVWQGSGEQDDPREETTCPVCGPNATEEPEWREDDDADY